MNCQLTLFFDTHVSENLYELLHRERGSRPSARDCCKLFASYCSFITTCEGQFATNLVEFPSYSQWKNGMCQSLSNYQDNPAYPLIQLFETAGLRTAASQIRIRFVQQEAKRKVKLLTPWGIGTNIHSLTSSQKVISP